MLSAQSDKKWLIKSENKILGPYSYEQVENLIFKKQISLIDEIRDSETRWLYIRENPSFKKIIEDVRNHIDSKNEATKTVQTSQTSTNAQTSTQTNTTPVDESSPQATDAGVPQFTDVSFEAQDASVIKETVEDVIKRIKSDEQKEQNQIRTKYVMNDNRTKRQVGLFSRNFFVLIAFTFVVGIASVVSYYFYNKYNQQKLESELIVEIKRAKFLGLESKAVTLFSRLPRSLQRQYLSDLIDLFPLMETMGLVQVKDLDRIESTDQLSVEKKARIHLARYWMFMQTQNLDGAQNQIIKAKSLMASDSLINENEAILNLKRGKYASALDSFLKLYEISPEGRYLVGAVQCLQGLTQEERNKFYPIVAKHVDKHVAIRFDYRKELLLVQMAFARLNNNDIHFKLSWGQFLNTPVRLSSMFRKPALLAPFSYLWRDLEYFKTSVREGLNPTEEVLFKLHDFLEATQVSAAADFVEKNKSIVSDVALKQQMSLLVYSELDKNSEAVSLEKTKQLDSQSVLNQLLLALAKINLDPNAQVDDYIKFFESKNLKFYQQWIELAYLTRRKATTEIRNFIRENSLEDSHFVVALEARGLLE